ncbi:protein of unknown function [Xenorhabdus doucetiae]|uniref:Uncharacterized protein n=1 Tax=Xenorhabdus doucetiae TaxID=351671 RepID=A0A068QSL1_9GAMM|nr:protein of unknown function [Xenorhabdus doucetiae]
MIKSYFRLECVTKWLAKMVGVSKKLSPIFANVLIAIKETAKGRTELCLSYHQPPEMNGAR